MKYLKFFNEKHINDVPEDSEFKIGDYVRYATGDYIWQITQYNLLLDKFYLEDTLQSEGYKRPDLCWMRSDKLTLVPAYELDAPKYNL